MCSYVWVIEKGNLFLPLCALACAEQGNRKANMKFPHGICVCSRDVFGDPFLFCALPHLVSLDIISDIVLERLFLM